MDPRPARRPKSLIAAVATVASSLALILGLATPAEASAGVCVIGDSVLYSCQNTNGSGGRVDSVIPSVSLRSTGTICQHRAEVRISAYGNPRHRFWTPTNAGCSLGASYLRVNVNETFPRGSSYVCVKNFVKGQQQGREICIKLT
jgi:hypothetical protein